MILTALETFTVPVVAPPTALRSVALRVALLEAKVASLMVISTSVSSVVIVFNLALVLAPLAKLLNISDTPPANIPCILSTVAIASPSETLTELVTLASVSVLLATTLDESVIKAAATSN